MRLENPKHHQILPGMDWNFPRRILRNLGKIPTIPRRIRILPGILAEYLGILPANPGIYPAIPRFFPVIPKNFPTNPRIFA